MATVEIRSEDFEVIYEAIKFYNLMEDDSQIEESVERLETAWELIKDFKL